MAKFLLYCPEAYVKPHLALMTLTGRTLRERGHDVALTTCFDLFPRCVPKASTHEVGWSREKEMSFCETCRRNGGEAAQAYDLPTVPLSDYVTAALRDAATKLIDAAPDLLAFEYDGERVGFMAAFLYTLRFKSKPAASDPPERRTWFREHVLTTLMTLMVMQRLLENADYTHLIVFNFYPPNMAAMRAAYRKGMEVRILSQPAHLGIDRRYAWVLREEVREYHADLLAHWNAWREKPISQQQVTEVAKDTASHLSTSSVHVYSPGKTIEEDYRQTLGLPTDKKIVAIYTSSPDEPLAADYVSAAMRRPDHNGPEIFPNEASWLIALRDYAARRPDLTFLVRMHPRLDGNKRESIRSPHLAVLESALAEGPPNWRVFWPQDAVSSYDILEIADVMLTSWSTLALEGARMGLPVMMAFWHNRFIPYDDFVAGRRTVADYFTALDALIGAEADMDRIIRASRYHITVSFSASVALDDVYPAPDFHGFPRYRTPARAAELETALIGATPLQHLRLADRSHDTAEMRGDEREAVRIVLWALLRLYLIGRYEVPGPEMMVGGFEQVAALPDPPAGRAVVAEKDNVCLYREGMVTVQRYSPLAARLIRLIVRELTAGNR